MLCKYFFYLFLKYNNFNIHFGPFVQDKKDFKCLSQSELDQQPFLKQ